MTDESDQDSMNSIGNAEAIIERFGGIRPMATKMNVPVTTVQGWKKRNVIPGNRRTEIMQAAQTNNVDLSDLIAGVANENSFLSEVERAGGGALRAEIAQSAPPERRKEPPVTATTREEPVMTVRKRGTESEPKTQNDQMFDDMRKAQSMSFSKSAWFTVAVVSIVLVACAALVWPSKEQLDRNTQDIAKVQGEVTEMRAERHSFLKDLIPGDIEGRLAQMQEQTQNIQSTVTGLTERVETIASDVMDPNATVGQKIGILQQHAAELGAPVQLTALLQKFQSMQVSIPGQEQLSAAVADLNQLLATTQAQGGDVDAALQAAQQENDALGQTLAGVPAQDLKAAALLLGLSQFRSSLNRNAPFEEDLALMQKLLGEDDPALQEAVARLAPQAEKGVLTPDGLKGQFTGLAGDIVVSSLKGEDISVQEKAKARLDEILHVEREGEPITGTDTQAAVARAQKMLDAGDVPGAIAELQSLEGEAKATAQPFVDQAQMTLMAQHVQDMMTGKVISRIETAPGIAVQTGGIESLIREIRQMATQRHVIRDEESGFAILPPKQDFTPGQ